MTWFFAALLVALLGAIAVVASGRAGSMPPAYDDRPDVDLPDGPLDADTLRRVRFPLALRGYRMEEVDALLDRIATQLEGDAGAEEDGEGSGRVVGEAADG